MRRVKDHQNPPLVDPFWYLESKRRAMLEEGWPGLFRKELLKMPLEELGQKLHERHGRPSKELYVMCGGAVLQEVFNLTDEQAVRALAFDQQWHYAMDMQGESDETKYISERTLRTYRKWIIELGLDKVLYERFTGAWIERFGVSVEKQRLDSTHFQSNMRALSRVQLFGVTVERFLRALKRCGRERYEQVLEREKEWEERYGLKRKMGCFSIRPSQAVRTLEQMGEDIGKLVQEFGECPEVNQLAAYRKLQRLFEEQCEVVKESGEARVRVREPKEVSADSLQNPSDPDAGYDAHKGQGYQVQIMETYREVEGEEEDGTIPDLITFVKVESASASDTPVLLEAVKETQELGWGPQQVLVDTSYGSDANVQKAKAEGVEVIAPSNPGVSAERTTLGLEAFEFAEDGTVKRCPKGQEPIKVCSTEKGQFHAEFDRGVCDCCELRARCRVQDRGEVTRMKSYDQKKLRLALRRQQESTKEFQEKYRWRVGIEASHSRLKYQFGGERLRVRGHPRVRLAIVFKTVGVNLMRCAKALEARRRAFLRTLVRILIPKRSLGNLFGLHQAFSGRKFAPHPSTILIAA